MLREEISRLISREQSLDSFLITVTDVDLSPDLKQACVYFSSLNEKTPSSQIEENSPATAMSGTNSSVAGCA
jgi:ribosome-binding factor A